jgi:integrase
VKALLSDGIDDFLRWKKSQGFKPTTIRAQTSVLRRFLTFTGNIYIDKINELTVTRYFEEASKTKQAQSLRNDHTGLSVFFDWCRHTRRMSQDCNPLYGRRMPKTVRRERNRLNATEFPSLLDAAEARCERDRAAVAVLLYTLLRDREVADLRVMDVDLEGGWLRARIHKTGQEDRMPISEELDGELRRWLTCYTSQVGPLKPHYRLVPARRMKHAKDERGWYTGRADEEEMLPERAVGALGRIVGPVLEDIGFPVTGLDGRPSYEGAHTIRRSGARALFDALVEGGYDHSLRVVQSLLHHSSIQTTERYIGITADRRSRDDIIRGHKMYRSSSANVVPIRVEA